MGELEQLKFNGRLLKVFVKPLTLPNGHAVKVEYVRHPGAVLVIPVLDNGSVILIRQFRAVIDDYIWELPAGTLEPNEWPMVCAHRELIEETGYQAKSMKKIAEILLAPGYSTEKITIYQAAGLKRVGKQAMPDEVIAEKAFTRKQLAGMIKQKRIVDAKTICALAYFLNRGK